MDDLDLVSGSVEVPPPGPDGSMARMSITADDVEVGKPDAAPDPAGSQRLAYRRRRRRGRPRDRRCGARDTPRERSRRRGPGGGGGAPSIRWDRPRYSRRRLAPQPGQFVYTKSESLNESTWVLGSGDTSTSTRLEPVTRGLDRRRRFRSLAETTATVPSPRRRRTRIEGGRLTISGKGRRATALPRARSDCRSSTSPASRPIPTSSARRSRRDRSREDRPGTPRRSRSSATCSASLRLSGAARGVVRGRGLAPGGATGRGHDRRVRTPWIAVAYPTARRATS